jgi:hypothetical protein
MPRIAVLQDDEAAAFVREYPGMFTYEPDREVFVMKPWAVSAGLRGMTKGAAL